MNKKQLTLSCAVLACLVGLVGQANANDVTSEKTTKASAKTVKKTTASKTTASQKAKAAKAPQATKMATTDAAAVKTVVAPVPAKPVTAVIAAPAPAVQSANPYLTGQNTNPYLADRPANPYLTVQTANPYLAAPVAMPQQQAARPVAVVATTQDARSVQAAAPQMSVNPSARRHITLSPLPVDIYMNPGMKPAVAFTTPCITIAKMTNNFPPIMAFENFMFDIIGKVNASDALPFSIEPVCT